MLLAQIKSYLKFKIQQKFDLQNQSVSANERKKKQKKTVSKQNPKKGKKQGLKNSALN